MPALREQQQCTIYLMIEGHDMLAKMSARKSSTLGAYYSAVISMHSVCQLEELEDSMPSGLGRAAATNTAPQAGHL